MSWDEAIDYAASEFKRIQAKYGRGSIGGITSSRCTNEETYLVQKLIRAAFGNNNVDTCARVCHSPTGYGLKTDVRHLGRHAGFRFGRRSRRHHGDRRQPDRRPSGLRLAHEAAPARRRQADRHRSARASTWCDTPHVEADYHLPLRPGTNVAIINALAHVVVTEGLVDEDFVAERCEPAGFQPLARFRRRAGEFARSDGSVTGVPAADVRAAARLYATGGNGAIYYGLGVTEHSQGSTMVMGMANLAMATGNIGRDGVGVNPLRGQNNVQGSCDMGSFPHEFSGLPPRLRRRDARHLFEKDWGVTLDAEPGLRIPNMFDAAIDGTFKGLYVQGEDIAAVRSQHPARHRRPRGDGMRRRAGPLPERDRELRACLPAGLVVPGEGRHLHQCRAPHQPRAQGDAAAGGHGRLGSRR